jgi:hypothetical protein
MCLVSTPDVPDASSVPDRQPARSPDNGDPSVRSQDKARRRLALAASVFTPQNGTLGVPAVTGNVALGQ